MKRRRLCAHRVNDWLTISAAGADPGARAATHVVPTWDLDAIEDPTEDLTEILAEAVTGDPPGFDRAGAEIEFVAGGLSRNTRCKYRKKQDGKERIANSKSVQALHA